MSAHKRSGNLFALIGSLLAIVFLAISSLHPTVRATGSGWLSGGSQVTKIADSTAAEFQSDPSCTVMTVPVVRSSYQQLFTNNEQHCMVNTDEGLVDDRVSVIQSFGAKGYVINSGFGGGHALVPTPNYPGAMLFSGDSNYPGSNVGLYELLTNHLKFNNNLLAPAYNLTAPDLYFKYPSGHLMAFNGTGSFSSNGTYWVIQAVYYGFVRVNLTTLQMTAFADNTILNSGGYPQGAITAVSPTGKYAAVAYNASGGWGSKYFKIVDVDTCGNATGAYVKSTTTCKAFDYFPDLKNAIPGLSAISRVQFANDNSLNFVAAIQSGSTLKYARYEVTAAGQPQRLVQYLALGDSFASGEGTFNYTSGTDEVENKCHQSIYSYPFLMTDHVGMTASVACSGAVIDNIIGNDNTNNDDQLHGLNASDPNIQAAAYATHFPGVLLQRDFVAKDNPQIITVSIGGNDFGFMDIMKRCTMPFNNISSTSQNCYQTYEDRIELVNNYINPKFNNLAQTYRQLLGSDPTRRVYVVGYPYLVRPDGDCGDNVRLSKPDTEFANELVDYIDSVIERAAAKAGVGYIDTRHAFDGHRLCEPGEKAINGITAGNDVVGIVGKESYHPNKLGHNLIANTILDQTHNLSGQMPKPQIIPDPLADDAEAKEILNVPKTNRVIYEVKSAGQYVLSVVTGLNPLTLGLQGLLLPASTVQAVLHSDPVNVGTLHADSSGLLAGNLQIPAGVTPGFHTLHLYGKDIFGNPLDVQETVYLQASATDYDGDSIANASDSCPTIPNSGHDVDQDGIDDACDPVIGDPPVQIPVPPAPIGETLEPTGTVADSDKGNGVILGDITTVPGVIGAALQPAANTAAPNQQDAVATILAPNEAVLGQESQVNKTPATSSPGRPGRLSAASVGIMFVALFGLGLALFAHRRSNHF